MRPSEKTKSVTLTPFVFRPKVSWMRLVIHTAASCAIRERLHILVPPLLDLNGASCSKPRHHLCVLTNFISFVKLTRSSQSAGKSYSPSALPTCFCLLPQLPGVSLGELPMDGLQSITCFEMAGHVLGQSPAAAGWEDNSQPRLFLWEFLRELQVAMNSLAFGREVLQRGLPLCPLALNLMKETSPEPKRLWRAWGGGLLRDRLSCVQIPLGWPWGDRLFSRTKAPLISCN